MHSLTEKLKQKKLKVTPQRLTIYKILSNTTAHPNAETIYSQLSIEHPTISLATVYKTLEALNKAGLIQEMNVGEPSFRYDANPKSHPHFICRHCEDVLDLDIIDVEEIKQKISINTRCVITEEQLYFYGTCEKCNN